MRFRSASICASRLLQRAVFMDDDPGFPGVVDVHPHLGAFLARDFIVRKVETGFLPVFDPSKALLLIFFQKMVSDADEKTGCERCAGKIL